MIKTMCLFLLLLLKILGWIFLILLLFLITMLLLVLFIPVRYDVLAQNERSVELRQSNHPIANLKLRLKATWLLHLIHVSVNYGPDGIQNEIRVAGIDILKVQKQLAKRKEEKQKRKKEKKNKRMQKEPEDSQKSNESGISEGDLQQNEKKSENSEVSIQEKTEKNIEDTLENTKDSIQIQPESNKVLTQKANLNSKQSSKKAQKQESGRFSKIRSQMQRIHQEFTDESNRHAVSHLWKEILKILRSYKPRKMKADLTFSLANPALTGEVTGIISLMPLIYRYPCSITPDFISEKLYIEGEIQARGKVTVSVFLLSLLRLLRDREFKKVVRRIMKR